jgi:hypothetical protein
LKMLSSPIVDPFVVPEGAPFVVLPEDFQHVYLLVISDPKNKVTPVKMLVVNANYDKIGRGEMLWFNLTKSTVAGYIGSQKLQIKPGARSLIKAPASGQKDYSVKVAYRMLGEESIRPLCETRWSHDARSRSLVFIVNEKNRKLPRIRSFSDYRIPEKDAEPK